LIQTGFSPQKTSFVPVGAMQGINLVSLEESDAEPLKAWYKGPTLCDCLGINAGGSPLDCSQSLKFSTDTLEPPDRDIQAPLRFPISNVFKGQSAGTGVAGRVCGGVVQVGDRLRVLPGDETATVRCKF